MKIKPFHLMIAAAFTGCGAPSGEEEQKPNIIYIMADDMGVGDVGCYGQEFIQTPNIDRMASEGMRFTRHYAGTPVCAPCRCMLMTGRHSGHAYVRGNMEVEPSGQLALPDEEVTVGELLRQAGYETAVIGKWGLGVEGTEGEPDKQGFDLYYGYLDQVLAHNYYPEYLLRNGEREYLDNEVHYLDTSLWHDGLGSYSTKKVDYSHDLFTGEAMKFIEDNSERPFFLYLAYTIPHNNGEAPEGEKQEVPDQGIYREKEWDKPARDYAAMITRMDKDVGAILDQLQELGIDENTLVIFTSDNGPMKNDFNRFFDSNGPYRGYKRDLYEGGVRMPFIAWWPGRIEQGATTGHISAFWDFLPTACELAGVEPPEDIDGISYLPVLLGKEQPEHEFLYWEFPGNGYQQSLLMGKWKAIRTNMIEDPDAPVRLYDLSADTGEENDIAGEHPELVEEIMQKMEVSHTPSKWFPMPGE